MSNNNQSTLIQNPFLIVIDAAAAGLALYVLKMTPNLDLVPDNIFVSLSVGAVAACIAIIFYYAELRVKEFHLFKESKASANISEFEKALASVVMTLLVVAILDIRLLDRFGLAPVAIMGASGKLLTHIFYRKVQVWGNGLGVVENGSFVPMPAIALNVLGSAMFVTVAFLAGPVVSYAVRLFASWLTWVLHRKMT